MQNFGGLQSAFGPGVSSELSRQSYLRRKYPGFSLQKAEEWEKDRRRLLTPNEIALARSIYASSIRYEQVSVYQRGHRLIPTSRPHAPDGNIYFPDATDYEPDFAISANFYHRSTFIHEMCHIWQYQHGMIVPLHVALDWKPNVRSNSEGKTVVANDKNYVYAHMFRTDGWRQHFASLDAEAQAEFMSDYFRVKHGRQAVMQENRGFKREDYEAKLPPNMRKAGVGA